jgi:HK97 family phage major capsid protein
MHTPTPPGRSPLGFTRRGRPVYQITGASTETVLTVDDLKGKTPEELRKLVEVVTAQVRSLHQTDSGELRDMSDAEESAVAQLLEIRDSAIKRLEQHREITEVLAKRPPQVRQAIAALMHGTEDPLGDIRSMTAPAARDLALRKLDARDSAEHLTDHQKTQLERTLRRDTDIARRLLVTETEQYRSAWMKLVTQTYPILDDDERNAVARWNEYRAMAEGVTTSGGFGIPVLIDPSIILTAQETDNPFLALARQVPVNTNMWKGVSSAGVTWSFETEGTAVSDDTPVLAQPTVPVWMARGFIPFSIEVGQDYPTFADEMQTLLAAGYDELLVDKFTRGTGTTEPRGLLTALSANTNTRVALTTAGSIGSPDPYKAWAALPQKFRRNAAWLMSVDVNNKIRQLGTTNVFHGYTVNLPQEWADQLFNKPVRESPYMPDSTTVGTATTGLAVVGDFRNYVIARRGGMTVEFIPHLFDVTDNRPTGQRGWFAYARIGGNSVNDLAFRLLANA